LYDLIDTYIRDAKARKAYMHWLIIISLPFFRVTFPCLKYFYLYWLILRIFQHSPNFHHKSIHIKRYLQVAIL
jgi:hypothetical protein